MTITGGRIGLFVTGASTVFIGDFDGNIGDVIITGADDHGFKIEGSSFAELANTTISGNGNNDLVWVESSNIYLNGGNSFTHDTGSTITVTGAGAGLRGFAYGLAADTIESTAGRALTLGSTSNFIHSNVTIKTATINEELLTSISMSSNSVMTLFATNFTGNTGTIDITGNILLNDHASMFLEGVTVTGDINARGGSDILLCGVCPLPVLVDGNINLDYHAVLESFGSTGTGTVSCGRYSIANFFGNDEWTFNDNTYAQAGCGPPPD